MSLDARGPGRPRVALFIRSLAGRGAERSFINLAGALLDRGVAVDLVLAQARGALLAEAPAGVRLIDLKVRSALGAVALLPAAPADFAALLPVLASLHAPTVLGAIPKLGAYLRAERPAALLSALDLGNVAAVAAVGLARTGVRLVLSQRNHLTAQQAAAGKAHRLAPLVRRFYGRADALVAVSDGVAADLATVCGLPRGAVRTIYNPVAGADLFARAAERADHPWLHDGGPPVVLGAGTLKPQKDFATLIRAFALVRQARPARLVILGEGPERAALTALAAALGVVEHVALPGFAPNPFAFMAKADLFVLSSLYEGLPGVLIQALACGCPVVSADCPSGPHEILEGGRHGPLTPVGDAAALARAMAATLDAPPDRDLLRRRGADFSFERAADAYLDVLVGP